MARHQGVRERNRAAITAEIHDEARRQLAELGAGGLSLRAVARELGMVSSAVYRYVASRDELLTALIVQAYDALGARAEAAAADAAGAPPAERWVATAGAVRAWAVAHPHEYALLYGSPVPGYAAPPDTVAPGTRVTRALVGIVRDAWATGGLTAPGATAPTDPALRSDLARVRQLLELDVPDTVLVRTLAAWTQLFGLVSFEVFGQTRGGVEHHEALFAEAVRSMADHLGLGRA